MILDASLQDSKPEGDMCKQTRSNLEKNLASPDIAKREKGMSLLCLWLTSQKEITEEQLVKIWQGLFYCLRHAEKEAAQVDLVGRMAGLMEKLDVELSLLFLKAFFTSLRKEWQGFDVSSLDRFRLLLRQYVSRMFAVLKRNEWEMEVVRKFMDAIAERAFLVHVGIDVSGISLCVVGVFLDELRHYLPIPAGVFNVLLEPFWVALCEGWDDKVTEEISKRVFLVLLEHGSWHLTGEQGSCDGDKHDEPFLGDIALNLARSIWTKSSSLLPFTSPSKSVQLRFIEEKFKCLEKLAQSRVCTNYVNENVSNDQTEAQSIKCSAESADILQDSVSPAQFPITRTFGRRSKRNQKLVFSPNQTDDVIRMKESVKQLGTSLDDFPVQTIREEMGVSEAGILHRDSTQMEMTASESEICMKESVKQLGTSLDDFPVQTMREETGVSEPGILCRSAFFVSTQMEMAASEPELNHQTEEINDVNGSPPSPVLGDEAEINNVLAANDEGIPMVDPVISNLAQKFDSIAEQSPCCEVDVGPTASKPLAPSPINTGGRKRKSWKVLPADALDSESPTSAKENNVMPLEDQITPIDNLSAKKAKKVHFSLQHNIVWQPSTPLPPHNVRVPPAATPRGSALKKGASPGPIVDPSGALILLPKKKKSTPRRATTAHLRSPKSLKNTKKATKPTKRGRLSPR